MISKHHLMDKHFPNGHDHPKRLVVPIEAVEAWEKIGYVAIGNIVQFPGLQEGTFWKEIIKIEAVIAAQEASECSEPLNQLSMVELIDGMHDQLYIALSYLQVCTSAITASVSEHDTVRFFDLRIVLNDVIINLEKSHRFVERMHQLLKK